MTQNCANFQRRRGMAGPPPLKYATGLINRSCFFRNGFRFLLVDVTEDVKPPLYVCSVS